MPERFITTLYSKNGWPVSVTLAEWQWFHGDGAVVHQDPEARLAVLWERRHPQDVDD